MKAILRWLLLSALLCLLSPTLWPGSSVALDAGQARAFQRELYAIADLKPQYLWGGAEDPKKGLDCSGLMYLAAKRAGIPGVKRTTAHRMAQGLDGWDALVVKSFHKVDRGDLTWWTWKGSARKEGHVGAVVVGRKSGLWECCHASSKAKSVVVVPFRGVLLDDLDLIRRLK